MATLDNFVKDLFNKLAKGEREYFFSNVADNVDWKVMGKHPLAGHYHSKNDFLHATFHRLDKLLKKNLLFKITNILIAEGYAVVEMESQAIANNDEPFDNKYCWVIKFEDMVITEVRAYVDSASVQKLLNENE